MITYPDQPWADGQTFVHTTKEGDEITGVYDLSKDTWSFYADNTLDAVFTNNVYTVDIKPADQSIAAAASLFDDALPLPIDDNLVTQQDVNWFLYDLISKAGENNGIWNDVAPPPDDGLGTPTFNFWWKPDEQQLYVWNPNKAEWVLTGFMSFDRPPIISGGAPDEHPDFPGKPLETGDFWFDTTTLEVLINYNGQWFPVSIPPTQVQVLREVIEGLEVSVTQVRGDIAKNKIDIDELRQDIIDGDFRPDLEQVLTQGNIADKGIVLTDTTDALVAIAPDEALIDIASDTSKKNPRLRLTHVDKLNYPDSQAQIELDENGTRVDFEFNQAINDVHFRFDDEEKFVLNKDGDAQFIGKVEGEPGTQNNEFVTYGQLTTLEEELEQLAPSLERGSWNFTLNHPPGPGEYTMISAFLDETDQEALCDQTYSECQAAAAGDPVAIQACTRAWDDCRNAIDGSQVVTTDDWTQCDELVFNDVDMNGTTHSWGGIDSDHYIDVFNMNDENYMVGDIATHGGGSFSFDLVSSKGVASGPATIKIFKTEGTVDFDQYVRKAGDTMTGTLNVDVGNSTALFVRSNLTSSNSIFYVRNGDNTTQFRVTADGKVQAGNQATTAFMATDPHDVITKKYADQYCRVPTAYQYELKYMETPTDAKAMELARVPGQWAKTNNGIWINRYDKNELVDLSPYFTSNQGSFTTPGDVEEDIEGEVSTFGDTLVLDYQGLYDNMRGFLSVYQKYNRERLGLRRMYAIPSVTWYKNEPFIKLTWSKNFNLDSLYFSECFLSLPGII